MLCILYLFFSCPSYIFTIDKVYSGRKGMTGRIKEKNIDERCFRKKGDRIKGRGCQKQQCIGEEQNSSMKMFIMLTFELKFKNIYIF